ncbi:MAG TPA: hypothetical protein VIG41_09995 [Micrococcaceae bacterium]|jgi:hypothetical protein
MYSFGSHPSSPRRPGRWAAVGPLVLALVFLVALVLAANNNTVLGWVIAVIAFGWLALATLSYIGLYKVARFGASQVRQAQSHLAKASGGTARPDGSDGGTRLVAESGGGVRDLKLDHSFKIIQVQVSVIADNLAAGDREQVDRALETIGITAANARGLLGSGGAGDGSGAGPDEGPIAGTVIP